MAKINLEESMSQYSLNGILYLYWDLTVISFYKIFFIIIDVALMINLDARDKIFSEKKFFQKERIGK